MKQHYRKLVSGLRALNFFPSIKTAGDRDAAEEEALVVAVVRRLFVFTSPTTSWWRLFHEPSDCT